MKLMNKLSFRVGILIFFLAIVPLGLFGLTALDKMRSSLLEAKDRETIEILRRCQHLIEHTLNNSLQSINLMAKSHDLQFLDVSDQEWLLQTLLSDLPYVQTLSLADSSGRAAVKIDRERVYAKEALQKDVYLQLLFKNNSKGAEIGQIFRDTHNRLLISTYIPLVDARNDQVNAILQADMDLGKLLQPASDIVLGKTGSIFIINDRGEIISHHDPSLVLSVQKALDNPLVSSFVSGKKQFDPTTYITSDGHSVFTNGLQIKNPHILIIIEQDADEAFAAVNILMREQIFFLLAVICGAILLSLYFSIKTMKPIRLLEQGVRKIGSGYLDHRIPIISTDELGYVTRSFNSMAEKLEEKEKEEEVENWLKNNISELESKIRGNLTIEEIADSIISFIATVTGALAGALYIFDGKQQFNYLAGYGITTTNLKVQDFLPGQGIHGQAVKDRRLIEISDIPADFMKIETAFGKGMPRQILIVPLDVNHTVEGVIELATLETFTSQHKNLLQQLSSIMAVALKTARYQNELKESLILTQQQASELKEQQHELQASNEELEEQTQLLASSERQLKEQQEELQVTNEELEEKTQYLQRNKKEIEEKNKHLQVLQRDLESKAADLAISSKYKSEFLANMSHELRTPLNSLLLLSKMFVDNKENNLTEEQIESATIIYNSGNSLLDLINEILDLAKIEAGKMTLRAAQIKIADIIDDITKSFQRGFHEKALYFNVELNENLPEYIFNDKQRIEQILKNFISNALKFTSSGGVTLKVYSLGKNTEKKGETRIVGFSVIDTGIGIPQEKQREIFEAFQQIEGGTSRKYGGTGLGLSISKELSKLLGGEILLRSEEGKGSEFILFIPETLSVQKFAPEPTSSISDHTANSTVKVTSLSNLEERTAFTKIEDDRDSLVPEDRPILIIEDDIKFARTLVNFCRDKGFKTVATLSGEQGLALAESIPFQGVILDIHLPGIDGWAVLDSLKDNPRTRHIPVHFISADDPDPVALGKGAVGYLMKPVKHEDLENALKTMSEIIEKDMKELLIIEDEETQRQAVRLLLGDEDIAIDEAATGQEAIMAITKKHYDCIILDLGLPDMTGFDLLTQLSSLEDRPLPPVVVYTGKELTAAEARELRNYSDSIILKGARSEERLLDETSLFLHRVVDKMPEEKRKMIINLHDIDQMFQNRTVLIVDDDMRNVFALSKFLKDRGFTILKAENGVRALEILTQEKGIDIILMDIMMPVMDGIETMKKIRADRRFSSLPIIALTAKAMDKDKENCIAAGANDYLSKPVDSKRLLSMMRVWLYQ